MKMFIPSLGSGVKQRDACAIEWINGDDLWAFIAVTQTARKPQVELLVAPISGSWDDVLDLQLSHYVFLWAEAVTTAMPRSLSNALLYRMG
jgi:hypothetical protein